MSLDDHSIFRPFSSSFSLSLSQTPIWLTCVLLVNDAIDDMKKTKKALSDLRWHFLYQIASHLAVQKLIAAYNIWKN